MAINPPSDIVLDVARAADPARVQAATARLARMAGTPATDFSQVLDTTEPAPANAAPRLAGDLFDLRNRMPLGGSGSDGATAATQQTKAYQGFEAVLLQSLVEDILPKDEAGFFGTGGGGAVWRGVFAEQLATQLAKSGKIGIARILATRSAAQTQHSAGPPAPTAQPLGEVQDLARPVAFERPMTPVAVASGHVPAIEPKQSE